MIDYEKQYGICGAIPSPDDDRDYQLDQLIMKSVLIPDEYIVQIPTIVADQKNTGCCVAASFAQIKHCQEYKETGDNNMFSAAYIYSNRKYSDYQGSGMYPRQALQNLVENGTCYQKDFPDYNTCEYEEMRKKYLENSNKLDRLAKPYRAASYYRLNDLDDIKMALYTSNQYVEVCYDIYKCFYHPDKEGFINYNPILKGRNYGGHSVCCIGYSDIKNALLIQNSWGKDYGVGIEGVSDGGCIWIPYEYKPTEAWACLDAPTMKQISKEYGDEL